MIDSPTSGNRIAAIIQTLGEAYLARGQFNEAIGKFRQLLKAGSRSPEVYRNLCLAYLGVRDVSPAAAEIYRQIFEIFPQERDLHLKICRVHLQHKALDDFAISCYQKALRLHPPFEEEIYYAFYLYFQNRGERLHAFEALKQVVLLEQGRHHARLIDFVKLGWEINKLPELRDVLRRLAEANPASRVIRRIAAVDRALALLVEELEPTERTHAEQQVVNAIRNFGELNLFADLGDLCAMYLAVRSHSNHNAGDERPTEHEELPQTSPQSQHEAVGTLQQVAANTPAIQEYARLITANAQWYVLAIKVNNLNELLLQAGKETAVALCQRFLRFAADYMQKNAEANSLAVKDGLIAVADSSRALASAAVDLLRKLERFNASSTDTKKLIIRTAVHRTAQEPRDLVRSLFEAIQLVEGRLENGGEHATAASGQLLFANHVFEQTITPAVVPARPAGRMLHRIPGFPTEVQQAVWHNPLAHATAQRPYILGRFAIHARLRDRPGGSTYEGRDQKLERRVILKQAGLQFSLQAERIPAAKNRILKSLQQFGQLEMAGLPSIYDMGFHANCFYYVRDFVEGKSLQEIVESGREFSLIETVQLAWQLCRVLAPLHRRRVWHCNLKFSNVWLLPSGGLKLVDSYVPGFVPTLSTGDALVGSEWHYSAPEWLTHHEPQPQCDVYAIGAMMYELLATLHPLESRPDLSSPDQVQFCMLPPLSEVASQLPPAICDVIDRACKYSPAERISSVAELENLLLQLLRMLEPGDEGMANGHLFFPLKPRLLAASHTSPAE